MILLKLLGAKVKAVSMETNPIKVKPYVTVYAKTDHMSGIIIFELTLVFTNTMPLVSLKEIGLIFTEIELLLYTRFEKVLVSNGQFVYVQYAWEDGCNGALRSFIVPVR